jgi:hypothetical protein
MFTHVVLFWVKPDAPANARQQIIDDCRSLLSKIPTLTFFDVGRPAMTPRDVVDNSYDDAYQTHELHLEFIARNKPNFGRVLIYDFVAGA